MLHHSHRNSMRRVLVWVALLALGLGLAWAMPLQMGFAQAQGYAPVHTGLEMVSIAVAVLVFASGWNAYGHPLSRQALILSCAFLGVALLDVGHALSYVGMPDFVGANNPHKAITFWLAARLLAASALLAVTVLPPQTVTSRLMPYAWLLGVLGLVAVLYWVFLAHPEWVPATYRAGDGLTPFKVGIEYAIIAMNLATAWRLWDQMRAPQSVNAAALFGAACVMALSEGFFTLYVSAIDFYNVAGHLYKVVASLFLYRAIFVEVVEAPYRDMAEMRDQLSATLEAVPDIMLELDLRGRYHAVHASRPEQLLRPAPELLASTIHEVLPPAQAQVLRQAMEDALVSGTSSGTELAVPLPQGTRWFELSVSRKGAIHGLDTRFIVLSRDVSARKRAEAAVLEQQAMARAGQAKSQFLSRVSHELRTPLNAVIGFAQLLLHDANAKLAAGQRLHVEYILRAGQHLLEMINDILDLTRIESGDAGLTLAPVGVEVLLGDSLPMVRPQAEAMGVSIEWDLGVAQACQVLGDERRLKQVLLNLLSNAVKYNRVGGQVRVHADVVEVADHSGTLLLHITDTGRGLSTEQMKGLFEPFNRLGADRDGIEGTGLGLVISRRLMEAMGGDITLDSTEGLGTTVTLHLVLASPAAEQATAPAVAAPEVVRRPPAQEDRTIVLCIEDNPLNAALLRAIFDLRPDVKLLIAEDGASGLEKLQHNWPDLVLIDINLPDMLGGEVLQRLRQLPQGQGVTCIAMSADVSGEPEARAREQGFADFWPKPLDVDGVLLRLDAALAAVKARRRAQAPTHGAEAPKPQRLTSRT